MARNLIIFPLLLTLLTSLSVSCGETARQPGAQAEAVSAEPAKTEAAQAEAVVELKNFDWAATSGKVTFIELWGVWCPPCIRSMPHVEEVWKKYRDYEDFNMMVINTGWRGDTPAKVRKWLKRNSRYTFPVYFDNGKQNLSRKYGVQSIPRSIILDRNGEVAYNGHPMKIPKGLLDRLLES